MAVNITCPYHFEAKVTIVVKSHVFRAGHEKGNGPTVMKAHCTICCHIKDPQFGVSDVVTMHHSNEACTIHNEDPVNQ